jgi:predicted kinase
MTTTDIRLLIISGSMGSGKTTVLAEASAILLTSGIAHAAIDVDAVAMGHIPTADTSLVYRNVAALWSNYLAAGVTRILLAEPIDTRDKGERFRDAIGATEVVVCRLRADLDTMQYRVRAREPGMNQQTLVNNVADLEESLDRESVEGFSVANDGGRTVAQVAREMLSRAGWLSE